MALFGQLAVAVIGDTSKFNQAMDDAEKKGSSFGEKLSSVAAGVGKAVASGLAVAGTAFATLATKALQLGGDLEQNLGGAEAVFGKFASTVESKGNEAFRNLGLSTSDYLATANKMGALFQGAGFGIEESMDLSTEAMQRAADVASIMGLDTSAAMDAVAGAAKGNFTMMDNLGVAMNDTAIGAYAMSKGITKSTKDMSQQEKIGLAMEMFLEKTSYAAGNYAKENDTLAGSLSTAKAALTNFLSGSGDASGVISTFSNAADVIVRNLQELLPRLTDGLTQVVQGLIPKIPPLVSTLLPAVIQGATAIINGVISVMPELMTVVVSVLPTLVTEISNMLPLLMQAGIDIITQLALGIGNSLPALVPVAVQAIASLVQALVDSLPMLLDAAMQLISGLADGIINAIPVLMDAVPKIIDSIVSFLVSSLPKLIQTGVTLLTSLIDDLPRIISTIVNALPKIIDALLNALLGNIPLIIKAGIQLLTSLVEALPQIIQTIVAALPQIISSIVNAIVGNIPMIVQAGVDLFVSLVKNLPTIIMEIVRAVPQIISSIVSGFAGNIGQMVQIGGDLIRGIWQGISDVGAWLRDKISGFFGGVVGSIKSFFGIHSPSTLFADEIGWYMGEGVGVGFEDAMEHVRKDMQNAIPTSFDMPEIDIGGLAARTAMPIEAIMRGVSASETAPSGQASGASSNPIVINLKSILNGHEVGYAATEFISQQQGYDLNSALRAAGVMP